MAQKFGPVGFIFCTPTKIAPTSSLVKFCVNPMETFQENRWKLISWPILALLGTKQSPEIWPTRAIFHTLESTHNVLVNQVSWSDIKNVLRKWRKNSKIPNFFYLFFVIKDPLKKIRSKKSKFNFYIFFGNIVVLQAKYQKDRMKTEGAYSIWKKVDGWTERRTDGRTDGRRTARHRINSTDYVSSGAEKKKRNDKFSQWYSKFYHSPIVTYGIWIIKW